jgi:NAD(P)H-flavin reductase/hemoglobin-like flavoprotein
MSAEAAEPIGPAVPRGKAAHEGSTGGDGAPRAERPAPAASRAEPPRATPEPSAPEPSAAAPHGDPAPSRARTRVLRLVPTASRPTPPAPVKAPAPAPTALTPPPTVPPPEAMPTAPLPSPAPRTRTIAPRQTPGDLPTAVVPRVGADGSPDDAQAPATQVFAAQSAAPATAPRSDAALAAEAVRAVWSRLSDQEADVAHWFGALLFSLAPALRARFPMQADPAARRLLRSAVAAMSVVDRPAELEDAVGALAKQIRALELDDAADEPVGIALIGAVREYAAELWAPGADAAWVLAYSRAAEPARRLAATLPGVVGGTVVAHRRLSWDLAVVTVAPDTPVDYRPGQWVTVEVPQRPRMWRSLTPAGAPREDGHLEFHVRAVQGGWVSRSIVAHSQCGERWNIGPAEGDLAAHPEAESELLLVAGGTGASVALALCEDLAAQAAAGVDVRPTTVIIGGRTPEDLHTLDRFAVLAQDAPWLAVVGACESDPLDLELAPGTIVEAVTRAGPWLEHDVVVAGSPEMIRATTAALLVDGTSLDRIHYDPFTEGDED